MKYKDRSSHILSEYSSFVGKLERTYALGVGCRYSSRDSTGLDVILLLLLILFSLGFSVSIVVDCILLAAVLVVSILCCFIVAVILHPADVDVVYIIVVV